jgi:YesN/AraC family two-component response regulator
MGHTRNTESGLTRGAKRMEKLPGISESGKTTVEDAIIIIDDEKDIRKLLRNYVSPLFSIVYDVGDGETALEIMKEKNIPIALVDLGLPDINGLDLIDKIAAISPGTASIILTGNSDREVVRQALKKGAYDFLDKPCDAEILRNTVSRAREVGLYRREMGEILEFLICEYGRFTPEEYQELPLAQRAQLLTMVKGILALKATRKKTSPKF